MHSAAVLQGDVATSVGHSRPAALSSTSLDQRIARRRRRDDN